MPFLRLGHLINSAPWWPISKSLTPALRAFHKITPAKFGQHQTVFKGTFWLQTGTAVIPLPMLQRKREGPRFARALKIFTQRVKYFIE